MHPVYSDNIGTHTQRSMDYPLPFTLYPLPFTLHPYPFYPLPLPPAAAARCFDAQHVAGFEPAAELCG